MLSTFCARKSLVHEFLVPPKAQLSYTPYLWLVYNGFLLLPIIYGTATRTETDPLTDRERQVLRMAGEGASSTDIANNLHLSHGTVRNYLSEAIGKLGVTNRIEAARLARQKGWL